MDTTLIIQSTRRFNRWFAKQQKWAVKKTIEAQKPQGELLVKPSGFLNERFLIKNIIEKI